MSIMSPLHATRGVRGRRILVFLQTFAFVAVMVSLASRATAQAPDPDDQYLTIYGVIQDADALSASGKKEAARTKYQQAQAALEKLHKAYPNWDAKLISFRMEYVAQKLAALSAGKGAGEAATGSEVKLLEAGAEPRKSLRLHPKAGAKQTIALTMKIVAATKVGAMEAPAAALPPMKLVLDLNVKNVSPSGEISYDLVLSDATVDADASTPAAVVEPFKAAMAKAKGTTFSATVSDRGVIKDSQMNTPGGADPQSAQLLGQINPIFSSLTVPLPEAEVGAGAKWQVRKPIKNEGMTIEQTESYELVSVDGDGFTARTTVTQNAANQKISSPAMPGMKVDLTKLSGTGSGTLKADLGQIVLNEARMTNHSDLQMAMGTGAQKQTITTKVDITLEIQGK